MTVNKPIVSNLQNLYPPSNALHFNQYNFWIPELNLIVYDYNEILSTDDENDNYSYDMSISTHEGFHSTQGITGTIFNMMAWTEEITNSLFSNPDINKVIKIQTSIDKLFSQARPLLEAEVACFIDYTIQSMEKNNEIDEKVISYLNANKSVTLKDHKTAELYHKMQQLCELGNDVEFGLNVSRYALDIPYVVSDIQIRGDDPNMNPITRFDTTFEILQQINEKHSICQRKDFSNFLNKPSTNNSNYNLYDLHRLLNQYTGFLFGPENVTKDRAIFLHSIQDPLLFCNGFKPDEASVKSTEDLIKETFDERYLFLFKSKLKDSAYVAFKLENNYILLPNYLHVDPVCRFSWQHMYRLWCLKESVLKGEDKQPLIDLAKQFLPDDMFDSFKNNVEQIYEKIDYSKIDPILEDEFKKSSNQSTRTLNWN